MESTNAVMNGNAHHVVMNGSHCSPFRQGKLPNVPSRCTYTPSTPLVQSPHRHVTVAKRPSILPNVLYAVGNTPLIRVNRITETEQIQCEVLAKCEFFNAGGSVKDRIAVRMIEDAEQRGLITPGDVLVEPTSGNTGIGLALAAAVKGYRCIIVMPDRMSNEKADVLKALGAEIIRTPSAAAFDSPESHIGVARRLLGEIPNAHILDQHSNPSNPLAHYDGTAEEVLEACGGMVDMVVMGTGTGGTLTGISRKIKERCPSCKVIGVDPEKSVISEPAQLKNQGVKKPQDIEGIGYDFVPTVCDRQFVDRWYRSNDKDSFVMARRMIKEEGILCGGSSGAAMSCALRAARDFGLRAGQRCVVILPDSIRNYMTKFLSDDWMRQRGFLQPEKTPEINGCVPDQQWWCELSVGSLPLYVPLSVTPSVTVHDTLTLLTREGFDQLPVVDEAGCVHGVVTVSHILDSVVSNKLTADLPVSAVMVTQFKTIKMDTKLSQLSRMLNTDQFVLVVQDQRQYSGTSSALEMKQIVSGIATRIDLLNFIAARKD